jgi:hypothetical protein
MTWSSVMTYMCLRCPRICFSYRSHNPSFFAVMTYPLNWSRNSMTEAIILLTHPGHMHSTPLLSGCVLNMNFLPFQITWIHPGLQLVSYYSIFFLQCLIDCLSSVCSLFVLLFVFFLPVLRFTPYVYTLFSVFWKSASKYILFFLKINYISVFSYCPFSFGHFIACLQFTASDYLFVLVKLI